MTEPENVRFTDVTVTDDGIYRITMVGDTGAHVIELDGENALRFAANLKQLLGE